MRQMIFITTWVLPFQMYRPCTVHFYTVYLKLHHRQCVYSKVYVFIVDIDVCGIWYLIK